MSWFSRIFSHRRAGDLEEGDLGAENGIWVGKAEGGQGPSRTARATLLPRFNGTASDQPRYDRRSPLDLARFRLRDAFTPSHPIVQPEMFAGRSKVLQTLIRAIEDQRLHVIMYGERGIGKTSLLHILARLAQDSKYIVRYTSCGEEADFNTIFRAILRDIPALYHKDIAPTSHEIESGRTFEDLAGPEMLTVPQVSDMLACIAKTRVLIILDEFDRAQGQTFQRAIAELIKNLSDRSVRAQLLVAGVAANLTDLLEHIPSIRRNILGLQIPSMEDDEVHELILNGQRICGLKYEPDVVSLISSIACGSPYIASLISQYAGLVAIDRNSPGVTKADVIEAITQSLDEIRNRVQATVLFKVAEAQAEGWGGILGLMACAVLGTGGRILPSDFIKIADSEGRSDSKMDELNTRFGLIAPISGDPTGAYRFCEDGLPGFLWMEYAEHRFTGAKNTAPAAEPWRLASRIGNQQES